VGLKVKDGVLEHDKPNDGDEDTGNIGAGVMLFCWLSPLKLFRLRLDVNIGGYGIELGSIPNQPWY
jgi:hypothetical protein